MTARCDYCRDPIADPRTGQRFCTTPGKHCRQRSHRAQMLPGTVSSIRQTKHGQWSITVRFAHLPDVKTGTRVRLETDTESRPDASGATNAAT